MPSPFPSPCRGKGKIFFKAISPCPPLLKRGGINMSRGVFDPTLQPSHSSERLAKERKGSPPFLEGRELEGRRF